jgi:hypothetical protein
LPIRLGQAQARGGLGQARGGQVTSPPPARRRRAGRSARQASGLLDIMLGRLPSHVSQACSCSPWLTCLCSSSGGC